MATSVNHRYKISELATLFGLSHRAIRYYEAEGLIAPERKGQQRLYRYQDYLRLSLIVRGKRLGFSLAEMRELFELYDAEKNTPRALQQMIHAIQQRQRRLQQQQEDIQAIMDELNRAETQCYRQLSKWSRQPSS
ncbi:hypothetical protein BZG82_01480 [Salinivibrio sp. PR5]|uniref:MerR family transcriptional regulator n=1 Tax=Salinivibrio sp. PR5 TaxID=1909484 RepID=UPI000989D452|nr:MerR family DNA-binding transcriptional regulator [Salinivibrio sp. PR5]OOF12133.1 hypothetical protein BZG82_01480 [Salinivibrio sp. PR5]